MQWMAAIQQAIIYMEEHLLEEINYEDVASRIHISSYEFHRAFTFLTGITANSYIRNRRMSLAGREIMETDTKITDIALKYGYETPESFTKAFTRFHGIAPKYARDSSAKLTLFNPLVIKISVEGGKSMDYRIVQTPQQMFLAITRNFRNEIINDEENHDISDFWDMCMKQNLVDPLLKLRPHGKQYLYGLCMPTKAGEDTFSYGIGIQIDNDVPTGDVAEMKKSGYQIWNVNPGTYVVFDCIGDDGRCISETWSRFYREFLPQMGYEAVEEVDYERYAENDCSGVFCELWIPVKKK